MIIVFGIALCITIAVIFRTLKDNKEGSKKPSPSPTPSSKNTPTLEDSSKNFQKKPLFIKTWTFEEFYKKFDRMQYGNPTNGTTGEKFKSCKFYKEGKPITYVGFHSSVGELTKSEIKERKHELKVGLKESGRYLFYIGEMPYSYVSEEIDLGL